MKHLKYADDIVIITDNIKIIKRLRVLEREAGRIGVTMQTVWKQTRERKDTNELGRRFKET